MSRWRVNWQFNRGFRLQRTMRSRREAREVAAYVRRLWRLPARIRRVS